MKKILLGSTALLAVGTLAASSAQAKNPIELGLKGYVEQFFGYGSSDIDDRDHFDQKSDSEVFFTGSTTLDNGIEFGVKIELEANTSSDTIDESYAYIKGDFGKILLGSENSVGHLFTEEAPNVGIEINSGDQGDWVPVESDANFAARGPLGATKLENAAVNDANRITYFTPRFFGQEKDKGLEFGISYTPDAVEDDNTQPSENAEFHDGIDLGVKFEDELGSFDVQAFGRYGTASNDTPGGDDPTVFGAGAIVGYAGLQIGGSYAQQEEGGENEGRSWELGASYKILPWSFSLGYIYGEAEGSTASGDEEIQTVEAAVRYALGPGIDMIGSVGYNDFDDDETGAADDSNDGYWIVTGLILKF